MTQSLSAVQMRSGVFVDPFSPDADTILIEDIALGLSREFRFQGQTRIPWSVAAHSCLVSIMCSPENKLAALLHDAAEAFLRDLGRPIKHDPRMASYRATVDALQKTILVKFGLSPDLPVEVKRLDDVACCAEAAELHHGTDAWPVKPVIGYAAEIWWCRERIREMLELDHEKLFLSQYHVLTGVDVHAQIPASH